MKRFLYLLVALIIPVAMNAQIGYQVALMDQSTGKPRANETVSVTVTISDNAGNVICSETSSATTNNFGMLALQVGDANTFNAVDWSNLPLWVTATVGGVTIGKTQILSVPVAEHAKHYGVLTPKILASKTWHDDYKTSISFSENGTFTYVTYTGSADHKPRRFSGKYYISANAVYIYSNGAAIELDLSDGFFMYFPEMNALVDANSVFR